MMGVWFLRVLHALLPSRGLAVLGEGLGVVLYRVSAARRHIGATNLRLCFPEWTAAQRKAVLKQHFRALGRATLLESVSWWGQRAEVERVVRFAGQEHLEAVAGRPVILLAPHFVGLNLGGVRVTAALAPIVSLYATIKNPQINALMLQARLRFAGQEGEVSEMYSRQDGIKPVLRALKKGRPFYYLPDMDYGPTDALFVPFFGVPTATITGLPRIAKAANAVVVPCVTRWAGDHYVTQFYPAWTDYPSGDVAADTRRMNAFIEDRIRAMPEQYFWLHKRFKTRPEGAANLYD
ncbi:MAG: lipid A biosynthesis acyltransferase [Betaproteobacteria bacterium]|nr:MAG: lipid A biosynthesis acyltransferase [Betaproteobacteria bacterium]